MDIPSLLRRSTDTDLMRLLLGLAETVRRLEEKVDILLIGGQVSESPDTDFGAHTPDPPDPSDGIVAHR